MSIKRNETAAAAGLAVKRKFFLFAVLFVLATLPHATQEFSFKFGSADSAAVDESTADDGTTRKATMRRRLGEKKFKFHKIERTYTEEDDDDGGGDDDNGEDNGNGNSKAAADASYASEEEEAEIQFERARKAQKARKSTKKASEETESSLFGTLFGGLFGGQPEVKKVKVQTPTNGIIDWLMWLGEKTGKVPPAAPPPPSSKQATSEEESWLDYLNRWPFNALFPLGKPAKSVKIPRRAVESKAKSSDRSAKDASNEEPMSQAHFESLLHTLPGFVVNPMHVTDDPECRQQMQVFHRQLRGKKLWTLQMLDATGKINSGVLRGNINQLGDFDLCTQVKTAVKVTPDIQMRIRGKYCLVHIESETDVPELKLPIHLAHGRGLWNSHLGNPAHFMPRYSVANWGVCIPHACPAAVVREMLEANLGPYNQTGVEFQVDASDSNCVMRPSKHLTKLLRNNNKFGTTTLYIAAHVALVVAALLHEYWSHIKELVQSRLKPPESTESSAAQAEQVNDNDATKEKSDETETKADEADAETEPLNESASQSISDLLPFKQLLLEVFKSFSPKRTLMQLLTQERADMEFPIFHVLKVGATFMLYLCLKYIMVGHLPISNRDQLVRFVERPLSVLFRAPVIYMDILLLLSGFVVAYDLAYEMAEKRYIHLLKRLSAKITRYLPTVYLVLALQTWILPHLGTGPLWSTLIGQQAQICEQQMWRNAFSVQNAMDFDETCSPMTIQLALEVQLYLLGPLIVWLYYTDADAGFFVYGALHAMSVAARFSRTNREHLSLTLFHGMNVSKFYRTANLLYSSPISRATPYLLGIGGGLLYRTQQGSLELMPELIPLGWALSALSIFWCFWSQSAGMSSDFVYKAGDAAAYAAWSPLLLGLALCWIIFMLSKWENAMLRFITTTRPVIFLSRLSLPLQLATYVVVVQNTAAVRETVKFQVSDLINFNEIGVILFYAIIFALIVDVPAQQLRHILVNRIFAERAPAEEPESEGNLSGTENSEHEISEEQTEQSTANTPEPADTIWASDPEEEEQKYLTRRRSSVAVEIQNKVTETDDTANNETKKSAQNAAEEEEEEEVEIEEEDEVKHRPPTPPVETPRRRRPISRDQ